MDLSKTLSKYNNQMIGKIKPIILPMSFLQAPKLLLLQYARSLVLERDKKLVCGIRVFIDWNS